MTRRHRAASRGSQQITTRIARGTLLALMAVVMYTGQLIFLVFRSRPCGSITTARTGLPVC
jgi:hypothetical protein